MYIGRNLLWYFPVYKVEQDYIKLFFNDMKFYVDNIIIYNNTHNDNNNFSIILPKQFKNVMQN